MSVSFISRLVVFWLFIIPQRKTMQAAHLIISRAVRLGHSELDIPGGGVLEFTVHKLTGDGRNALEWKLVCDLVYMV